MHFPSAILLFPLPFLLAGARADGSEIRAGAAIGKITPPVGIVMNGGTHAAISTQVHDDLHARSLVLDDGTVRLALVVVDNCLIDRAVFDQAKKLVQEQTRISPERVLMSCTHTHSAGSVTGVHLSEPDEAYRRWLPARLAETVRKAVDNLAPAQLAWGSTNVPQQVFCRRIRINPAVVYTNQLGQTNDLAKMNWDSPHPADLEPAGPTDPEVSVLSIEHRNGRPLALLANYSLHYVGGTNPGDLSADYYGVFCERIEHLLGGEGQDSGFVAIMSNGTSGDINNNDFRPDPKKEKLPPYTQIRRVAEEIAVAVQGVVKRLKYRSDVPLKSAFAEFKVTTRKPTAAEVEQARGIVHGRLANELKTWPEIYAREQLILAEFPDQSVLPLQVFRIGDLAVAAWPAEIFASTGLDLKRRSPIKPLFNVGLANGWFGYVPPPEQHRLGAYETWRGRTSCLELNATTKITDDLLSLLEKLK